MIFWLDVNNGLLLRGMLVFISYIKFLEKNVTTGVNEMIYSNNGIDYKEHKMQDINFLKGLY